LKLINSTTILAIESSCDETSAAVCIDGKIFSNVTANQAIHAKYGGVVPEMASRIHLQNIVPVVDEALQQASNNAGYTITLEQVDAIAFTHAPGLIGSLLVGAQFAKSLALALDKPLIAVHHMQAHVLANLIDEVKPGFPFLCLTVSGGHTQIVVAKSPLELEVIGNTIDDAAGEAFDKAAKLLGLPYPGGPLIDKYAALGNPYAFTFAKPHIPHFDFSFSGLKTSILYFLQKQTPDFIQNNLADICSSIQHTIIEILMHKLVRAAKETGIKQVCIAGGVSANSGLRKAIQEKGKQLKWQTYIPKFEYCTDNAAMIAITGYYKYLAKDFVGLAVDISARSNW
jgi:N6-L-threonylcarbamoyladenine synthase